ncbi:hypothetical protein AHAS_Ahas07G0073500 [Arachis hypogaea]
MLVAFDLTREVVHSCKLDPCVQRVLSARRALRAVVRLNVRNSPEGKAVQTLLDQYHNQANPIKEAETSICIIANLLMSSKQDPSIFTLYTCLIL